MSMGEFSEATESFDKGLEIEPHSQDLRNFKSECLFNLGRVDEALELTLAVLGDRPDSRSALDNFPEWLLGVVDENLRSNYQARFDALGARRN